jgi:hypothetical protein
VEVPEPVTLVGVRVQANPVLGETVVARATIPLKPCVAVMVIVEGPAVPASTVTLVELADKVKSWTVKTTVAECDRDPLVPVIATV